MAGSAVRVNVSPIFMTEKKIFFFQIIPSFVWLIWIDQGREAPTLHDIGRPNG